MGKIYTHTDGMKYSLDSEYGRLVALLKRYGAKTWSIRLASLSKQNANVEWRVGVLVDGKMFYSFSGIVRYLWATYGDAQE